MELRTVSYVSGPLIFADRATGVVLNEVVEVIAPDGEIRRGRILEVDHERAIIEVYAGTYGLDVATTRVRLGGDAARLGVGLDLLGRMLDGSGTEGSGRSFVVIAAMVCRRETWREGMLRELDVLGYQRPQASFPRT